MSPLFLQVIIMENIDIVEKSLTSKTAQVLSKEEEQEFLKVQQAAITFLKEIDFLAKTFLHQSQNQLKSIKEAIDMFYGYTFDTPFLQQCFVAVNKFEYIYNAFLGRQIFLTFVDDNGKILFQGHNATTQFYSNLTKSSKGGRGNYPSNAGANSYIRNFNNIILDNMRQMVNDATAKRSFVYQKALERSNKPMDYKSNKSLKEVFYWRTSSNTIRFKGWDEENPKGYNRGHIAETYVDLIINNIDNFNFISSSLEELLEILSNHIELDKTPGALKGDVVFNASNGTFQFAVKKLGNASTATLGPYIAIAFYLSITQPISAAQFQRKIDMVLQNKRTVANTILSDLLEVSKSTLNKHLEEYVNRLQIALNI